MKSSKLASMLLIGAALSAPALAAPITVTSTPGSDPYVAPVFTSVVAGFNFDSVTPEWDRSIYTGSLDNVRAQPLGSIGGYASVGPTDGSPGTLDLSGLTPGSFDYISLLWGSIDEFNQLEFLNGSSVVQTFVGGDIWNPANGNQTSADTNRVVTFALNGNVITGLRFSSSVNAFEVDNVIVAVPEPATLALLGLGLAGVGALRRRRV